jgi:hypothetical protein
MWVRRGQRLASHSRVIWLSWPQITTYLFK